jgi:hypothetical protein
MIIDKQVYLDAKNVVALINSGRVDEAMALDEQLRRRIVRITQSEPVAMQETIGLVATTLRKAGQKGMALPWYEDLCVLDAILDPHSTDTAWDWYYLADCYVACADSVNDTQSSREYIQKAHRAAEKAAEVYEASGATSDTLRRNINSVTARSSHRR